MKALSSSNSVKMPSTRLPKSSRKNPHSSSLSFAKLCQKEVAKIHTIQAEMHQKHSAAFQQLVAQLAAVTVFLRKYTIDSLNSTNSRITTFNTTEESDRVLVFKATMKKMNTINRKVEALHSESVTAVSGTQAYAKQAEVATVKAGDARLATGVAAIRADELDLGDKEEGDWVVLTAAIEAAEKKQFADNLMLSTKINDDIGALRRNSSAALTVQQADIHRELADVLQILDSATHTLNASGTHRLDGVQWNMLDMIAVQTTGNIQQEEYIAKLKVETPRMTVTLPLCA